MAKKIDAQPFNETIQRIFRDSVLSYQKVEHVIASLNKVKEDAFAMFKKRQFFESASFYKSLLTHALDYLRNVKDSKGQVGAFIYECILYFSQSVKQSDSIDKHDFFNDSIMFYLDEDMGFSDELAKLILDNCDRNDYPILESLLDKMKAKIYEKGSYVYEKYISLNLRFYQKFQNYTKYLEVCKWYPGDSWEHYVYAAEIYEAQQQMVSARNTYEAGLERAKEKEIVQQRFNDFKERFGLL